jgi:hypothetical protein
MASWHIQADEQTHRLIDFQGKKIHLQIHTSSGGSSRKMLGGPKVKGEQKKSNYKAYILIHGSQIVEDQLR